MYCETTAKVTKISNVIVHHPMRRHGLPGGRPFVAVVVAAVVFSMVVIGLLLRSGVAGAESATRRTAAMPALWVAAINTSAGESRAYAHSYVKLRAHAQERIAQAPPASGESQSPARQGPAPLAPEAPWT